MTTQAEPSRDILTQYADGPTQLEAALQGLTESDLDLALAADSWSIRQVVHHLADGDAIWNICLKAALGNPEGLFSLQWYWDRPQVEWAENWKYASRSIKPSLALLCANRRHMMELIQQIPNALEKSIGLNRPDGQAGRITVGEILEIQAHHVAGHIQDIRAIRHAHSI